jgi:molecular chaperone GrpE (heat shock protein)
MLSVLESLDDVMRSTAGANDPSARGRLQHFEREARAMAALVELDEIATTGFVDPVLHEVVESRESRDSGHPAGTILDVRQRGYAFRGRVIRPAQVVASV